MGDVAIRVNGLSKRYRIGTSLPRYGRLSESLWNGVRAPFRRLREESRRSNPEHIWALKDVSLEVKVGEVIGIIGRNGAGKTTLLKILSRITDPTEGYAEIRGRIGSLLEVGTGFHPELTGRENIYLNGAILGMRRAEITRKLDEIVDFAEVERFIDTPVKRFSSGMQVRLAFAVAAHLEPEILLVDEVLAVGDLQFQAKCLGRMNDIASQGRTVFFVSHQLNQIRRLCTHAGWLEMGHFEVLGLAGDVVAAYERGVAASRFSQNKKEEGIPQDSRARFARWEVLEADEHRPYKVESIGPVTVRFVLQVREPIQNAHHGIALYDQEGRILWGWAASRLTLAQGTIGFSYCFPVLPLRPSIYRWKVSLYDDDGLLDVWDCVPEMVVDTENYQHPRDEWSGPLNLPSTFEIKGMKEAAT